MPGDGGQNDSVTGSVFLRIPPPRCRVLAVIISVFAPDSPGAVPA